MANTDKISDIVKAVYYEARKNDFHRYATPLGEDGWPEKLLRPEAPGDMVYKDHATAYRAAGRDPGFPEHHPIDVPQSAIRANLRSSTDAFDIYFPDDAVANYIKEKLEQPGLTNIFGGEAYKYGYAFKYVPRPHEGAKLSLRDTENGRSFRVSLEADLLVAAASDKIDSPERVKKDRKVITGDELETAYIYSRHKPELWIGFCVWQNIISRYATDLRSLAVDDAATRGLAVDDPNRNKSVSQFGLFVDFSISDNISFQTFFIPHIVKLSLQRGNFWNAETLEAKDIVDGINLARKNGIFRRAYDTADGQRMIMCPFSSYGTRWMTMDKSGKDDPANSSIVRCYQKVLAEKETSLNMRELCTVVSDGLTAVLKECDEAPRFVHAAEAVTCPHAVSPERVEAAPARQCPVMHNAAKGPL